jgi:hypothetical protein
MAESKHVRLYYAYDFALNELESIGIFVDELHNHFLD